MSAHNLDGIRVQTARMMEIYALLRGELETDRIGLSAADRQRLQSGIDTIASNMRELLVFLTRRQEDTSSAAPAATTYEGLGDLEPQEARELEGILDAVLKWHAEIGLQADGD